MAGFCKAHMRAFCYSIRNMNYRQLLSTIGIVNLKP